MPLGPTTSEAPLSIPSLPDAGPLRLIAVFGSVAIAAWLVSALVSWRAKARTDALWAVAVLVLVGATMIAGRLDAGVHGFVQLLTVAVAARNVTVFRGPPRWLTLAGVVAWLVSAGVAISHFG